MRADDFVTGDSARGAGQRVLVLTVIVAALIIQFHCCERHEDGDFGSCGHTGDLAVVVT